MFFSVQSTLGEKSRTFHAGFIDREFCRRTTPSNGWSVLTVPDLPVGWRDHRFTIGRKLSHRKRHGDIVSNLNLTEGPKVTFTGETNL